MFGGLFVLQFLYVLYCKYYFPPFTCIQVATKMRYQKDYAKKMVPLRRISPYVILAAMAAEDKDFPRHNGFDWEGIKRAMHHNQKQSSASFLHGGSTISQQTAKNVFLWSGKVWIRKGLEVYFTAMIEWIWGKKRIMEVYLNVIEAGKGVIGIEAAAQKYYHKPARYLTMSEAAMIVCAFPNPRLLDPLHPSKALLKKHKNVLHRMAVIMRYPEYQYVMY